MTKTAEKNIPSRAAHTYIAHIREYPSRGGSQWLKIAADCNKVREDVAWLIYLHLGKHEIFFGISWLRKQASPCLLRGSLAFMFDRLLINVQHAKSVCGQKSHFAPKFVV